MKRVLIAALIFGATLFAIVFGVGAALPQSHVATVRTEISAPPEDVFEAIADYRAHPQWRPSVKRVEDLPAREGKPAWQEIGNTGPLPMELTESDPPSRLVTTILSEGMPFGGRWIYEIEAAPGGATVSITEEGEVYNPIFRFVSRFIMGHHGTSSTYLHDLAARFGDEVTIEIVR